MYVPVEDELNSISKQMIEIQRLLEQQIKIESSNNMLLRKLLKHQISEQLACNFQEIIIDNYKEKNVLVVNDSLEECKKIAKKIAETTNKRLIEALVTSPGELTTTINNGQDGDVIFYDVTNPFFDEEILEILLKTIKREAVEIDIGKGASSRRIALDLPAVYFVIYADMLELIPKSLKEVLHQV